MGQMGHFGDLYHEDIEHRDESIMLLGFVFGMGCFAAGILFLGVIVGLTMT